MGNSKKEIERYKVEDHLSDLSKCAEMLKCVAELLTWYDNEDGLTKEHTQALGDLLWVLTKDFITKNECFLKDTGLILETGEEPQ